MGAIENDKFDIQFIERTQKLIRGYKGKYKTTLLVNCLLGLVILPSEFYSRKGKTFFNKDLSELDDLQDLLTNITFNPTKWKKVKYIEDKKNLRNLIKKVRNGISHQHIEVIEENGNWSGVRIQDFNPGNSNNLELEVTWTIRQLKRFSFYVSGKYKEEIEKLDKTPKRISRS